MGFWLGSSLTSTSESELASLVLERNVTERIATERHVATEHHAVPCPTCPVQPPCEKEASRPCDLVQRVPFADYAAQNDLTLEHIFGRDFRAAGPDSEPAVTSNRALEKLFSLLTPYIAAEPHAPLRNTTPPTRLPDVDDLECSSPYFSGFRQTQARVVDILFVGFELDTLEVRLHELDDVVDEFVLFEGMYTQRGNRKPLYFAASENRFAHFLPKITRLVQDATSEKDFGGVRKDDDNDMDDWRNENTMRGLAVQKYLSMHSEEEVRASLFIQGDLDEIPGREAIQKFKFCQPIDDSLNFYYTFLHGTADVVRPQVNAHEKEYWIHGGVRNGEWLLTNPHKFRFVNTMYEASSGGYHLSRIMNPYGWILKLFALAEVDRANGKRKLHCAQLILNPVAYWRECVIRVDDLSGSVHPGWEHPWKDEWVLKRFEDWDGMYSRARSWVIEQNPDRYPWAHAATFGSVSDV